MFKYGSTDQISNFQKFKMADGLCAVVQQHTIYKILAEEVRLGGGQEETVTTFITCAP